MPGWHDATKELQEQGRVQMLGIVQEQNPERARLFMQWKQMEWPILVDTFNHLEVSVVPLTFAIDEHGIVRQAGLRLQDAASIEESFLTRSWPRPTDSSATASNTEQRWLEISRNATSGDGKRIEEAIDAYGRQIREAPDDGWAHFRLAAAHRLRYDSSPQPGDFQLAVDHWQRALDLDPNNYIWRRRIQQYGPRLDKPYPFYDWIETARAEIVARGELPTELLSEPTGSEIAKPSRDRSARVGEASEPDPKARVFPDGYRSERGPLIDAEVTSVPRRVEAGSPTRAHLVFRPRDELLAHWNNENEPLKLWIEVPAGWSASRQLLEFDNAETAVSSETRRLEVEITPPPGATLGSHQLDAHALYYVCEDVDGTCLYRRRDLQIDVEVVVGEGP